MRVIWTLGAVVATSVFLSSCSDDDYETRDAARVLLTSTDDGTIENAINEHLSGTLVADDGSGCVRLKAGDAAVLVLAQEGSRLSDDGTVVSLAGPDIDASIGEPVSLQGSTGELYRQFSRERSSGWDECVGDAKTVKVFIPVARG